MNNEELEEIYKEIRENIKIINKQLKDKYEKKKKKEKTEDVKNENINSFILV
tara:strand:+ start:317 stop:472 length:156 start_codon:yes stop_codon:yes gene_type:complete